MSPSNDQPRIRLRRSRWSAATLALVLLGLTVPPTVSGTASAVEASNTTLTVRASPASAVYFYSQLVTFNLKVIRVDGAQEVPTGSVSGMGVTVPINSKGEAAIKTRSLGVYDYGTSFDVNFHYSGDASADPSDQTFRVKTTAAVTSARVIAPTSAQVPFGSALPASAKVLAPSLSQSLQSQGNFQWSWDGRWPVYNESPLDKNSHSLYSVNVHPRAQPYAVSVRFYSWGEDEEACSACWRFASSAFSSPINLTVTPGVTDTHVSAAQEGAGAPVVFRVQVNAHLYTQVWQPEYIRPSGSVSIYDGGTQIASASCAYDARSGECTTSSISVPITGMTPGVHSITGRFDGDEYWGSSASQAISIKVK